jgi:hypothetical protein
MSERDEDIPYVPREKENAFVKSLVSRFPILEPILVEHLEDHGQILPHLFFADLTRYLVSSFVTTESRGQLPSLGLREILDHLESVFAENDEDLSGLIDTSFLQNLPYAHEEGYRICKLLGPKSRARLHEVT